MTGHHFALKTAGDLIGTNMRHQNPHCHSVWLLPFMLASVTFRYPALTEIDTQRYGINQVTGTVCQQQTFFFLSKMKVHHMTSLHFWIWMRVSPPHIPLPCLAILPPVLPLQLGSVGLKLRGTGLEGVCSVIQFRQLRISLQDLVHVDPHDAHHLRDREREGKRQSKRESENLIRGSAWGLTSDSE